MEPCASVESVKSVSEIYAPIAGEIVESNDALEDAPEAINQDPYGEGWIFALKIKELKHCRLAMFAWLGIISQTVSLNIEYPGKAIGALDAWRAHISNVLNCNVVDRLACFSN